MRGPATPPPRGDSSRTLVAIFTIGLVVALAGSVIQPALADSPGPRVTDATGATPCDCGQYRAWLDVHRDFSRFSAALANAGAAGETEILRRRLEEDDRVPAHCRELLMGGPRARPFAEARIAYLGSPERPSVEDGPAKYAVKIFDLLQKKAVREKCVALGGDIVGCLDLAHPDVAEEVMRKLQSDPAWSSAQLASVGEGRPGVQRQLAAFSAAMNLKSQAALEAWAAKLGETETASTVLIAAQMVGIQLKRGYDFSRSGKSVSASGAVSTSEMLSAARQNIAARWDGKSTPADDADPAYAGVCRDIAFAQASMLRAAKFRNVYVVMWTKSGTYHATVIARDPKDDTLVHQLNYGKRTDLKAVDGGRALFQAGKDIATNYRVYEPGGRQVANVFSEYGKLMAEVTGFHVQVHDPLARSTSSLVRAGMEAPGGSRVGAYVARDGNGANYAGMAASTNYGKPAGYSGATGATAGVQHRPAKTHKTDSDAVGYYVYVQNSHRLGTPNVSLGRDVRFRVEARADVSVQAQLTVEGGNAEFMGQGDLRAGGDATVTQGRPGQRYQSEYRVGVDASPGLADSRNLHQVGVALNGAYATTTQSYRLPSGYSLLGGATLVGNATALRGRMGLGLAGPRVRVHGLIEGRLTDGSALLEDGAIRSVGGGVSITPLQGFSTGVTTLIPLEGGYPSVFGTIGLETK